MDSCCIHGTAMGSLWIHDGSIPWCCDGSTVYPRWIYGSAIGSMMDLWRSRDPWWWYRDGSMIDSWRIYCTVMGSSWIRSTVMVPWLFRHGSKVTALGLWWIGLYTWWIHGITMGPWWIYDGSMVQRWVHDGYMMDPWYHDGSMMDIWWIHGTTMGPWWIYDGSMVQRWVHDGYMMDPWYCGALWVHNGPAPTDPYGTAIGSIWFHCSKPVTP